MNKMKIEILVLGPVQTNCYLIQNCETKEILVVDPADSGGNGRTDPGDPFNARPF